MRTLVALATIALGCHPRGAPTTGSGSPAAATTVPQADANAADARVPYDGPLLVGGDALVRIDEHGAVVETLVAGEAAHPRWLVPGETVLFLRHEGPRWQLVRLELASRTQTVVATDLVGDGLRCPQGTPNTPLEELSQSLDVYSDRDFRVGGGRACIALMERNENMADARLEVLVDLDDGRVSRTLELAIFCEDADEDVQFGDGDPQCDGTTLQVGMQLDPHPTDAAPFHVVEGRLLRRMDGRDELVAGPFPCLDDAAWVAEFGCRTGLPTFEEVSRSPSGRWVILEGNPSQGDYMHNNWLLLDAVQGELFAVADGSTTWPAPLGPEQLGALVEGATGNDVVGETPLLWLSGDRLVIGRRLIVPGKSVVDLPGDLVR